MAHHLNLENGKYSFVNAGINEKAWHGLGQHFPERLLTTKEAIIEAGLDYTVERTPLMVNLNGVIEQVPDYFINYRTDNGAMFNSPITNRYSILQNVDAFKFIDSLLIDSKEEYVITTAGALGKGETVFMTAKLPSYIRIEGTDDIIEKYLLLTHSHDGGSPVTVTFTPIRVVCNNTLIAALRGSKEKFTFRHTASLQSNLQGVAQLLNIVNKSTEFVSEVYNHLAKIKLEVPLKDFVIQVMSPETGGRALTKQEKEGLGTRFFNMVDDVLAYNETPSQQYKHLRGTKYGALNAVTGYYQNVKKFKSNENKFFSTFMKDGMVKKTSEKALSILLANYN